MSTGARRGFRLAVVALVAAAAAVLRNRAISANERTFSHQAPK